METKGDPDVLTAQAITLIEGAKYRNDVVPVYAHLIRSLPATLDGDRWGMVNRAILARWASGTLSWIKERAWKQVQSEERAARTALTQAHNR